MPRTIKISDNLTLDCRRAAWFPQDRVLAVADLHLGYAWAHRAAGQLMPISPPDDTTARLQELQRDYDPAEIIIVGDVVHRAMRVAAIEKGVRELCGAIAECSRLTFVAGNHDQELGAMLVRWKIPIEVTRERVVGSNVFLHGDLPPSIDVQNNRVIIGHEHPAISIGDGVATSQKCPCFLLSETVVVLPAFSKWAAGTNFRSYPFSSEIARAATFTRAVAICGERMLPVRV